MRFRYKKEHPEAQHKDMEDASDEWYETDSQRELRQVFAVQTQTYEAIRVLGTKLDEVIGRHERTLSMLSSVPGHLAAASGQPHLPDRKQHFSMPIKSKLQYKVLRMFFLILD